MEGGWGRCRQGVGIVLYRNWFLWVLADSALSVSGAGSPICHSLGYGGGGVEPCPKR